MQCFVWSNKLILDRGTWSFSSSVCWIWRTWFLLVESSLVSSIVEPRCPPPTIGRTNWLQPNVIKFVPHKFDFRPNSTSAGWCQFFSHKSTSAGWDLIFLRHCFFPKIANFQFFCLVASAGSCREYPTSAWRLKSDFHKNKVFGEFRLDSGVNRVARVGSGLTPLRLPRAQRRSQSLVSRTRT